MIHSCSSYCLRRQSAKKGNDSDKSVEPSKVEETVVRKCRMNFGIYGEKTKTSSGKPISPFLPNITDGAHPRYEGCRDHPHLVQHVAMRPLSWLANCGKIFFEISRKIREFNFADLPTKEIPRELIFAGTNFRGNRGFKNLVSKKYELQ